MQFCFVLLIVVLDRGPQLCGLRMPFLPHCHAIAASWLGVSPWLLQAHASETESLVLPKSCSFFGFGSLTFQKGTWEYLHNHFPLAKRQMGVDEKGGERQKERESPAEEQLWVVINYSRCFWKESPSHSLGGKPSFPSPALWVSLMLKLSAAAWIPFSMPPLDESWVDTLTAAMCPVLVHKLSQSEVQLCRNDLSAQLVMFRSPILKHLHPSRGDIIPGSSWLIAQSSFKKKFCITHLAWSDPYVELFAQEVLIWLKTSDLCFSSTSEVHSKPQWLIGAERQGKTMPSKWPFSHAPSRDL